MDYDQISDNLIALKTKISINEQDTANLRFRVKELTFQLNTKEIESEKLKVENNELVGTNKTFGGKEEELANCIWTNISDQDAPIKILEDDVDNYHTLDEMHDHKQKQSKKSVFDKGKEIDQAVEAKQKSLKD